ncbi:Clavaminate synthase-like protein [Lizonia empirigonia]|nr:Clavaminate synthase-like protein [Lizonia empirigonia]
MPHSDHSPSPTESSFADLPPFPDNVPTAPLLRISLAKLLDHDADEQQRCWDACQELGFFYLDLRGAEGEALLDDADQLFCLMRAFFELPVREKVLYDFKAKGSYFGYKGYGEGIVDRQGTRDRNEFYNISKDDILRLADRLPCPALLDGESERSLCERYISRSHAVCTLIIALLSSRLPLTQRAARAGGLQALHSLTRRSGDQVRFVRAPPQAPGTAGVALGEHTDFGSVTVLFNRLGGLQVRLPEHMPPVAACGEPGEGGRGLWGEGWCYVKPLPGHCIVNLGDALVKFLRGRLRSNIHRVVAPPGLQGAATRFSLVYFCRPGDDVLLESLVEGGAEDGESVTAKEWILRRALGRREVGGWEKSGGTEEGSMRRGGMRV